MAGQDDIALMAHLMRRAGFSATREELEERVAKGYEATVEELLNPESQPEVDEDIWTRYFPDAHESMGPFQVASCWIYRMINSKRPLEEKMALFWHQIFATGNSKVDGPPEVLEQVYMFRRNGMGSLPNLLTQLAKDPAMIYWLDNQGNHKRNINENWGRELLELFTIGVGNYTEDDIKDTSRAFTGWSITAKIPRLPLGRFYWDFVYKPEDHDYGWKTFQGETGRFNGEDIIDIIVKQPACARFLARHLYNFFVEDEVQVPAWNTTPPKDPEAINSLMRAYNDSNYDIRSVLRVLFLSDFFKNARFKRVKSPTELVIGSVRLAGAFQFPVRGIEKLSEECEAQGQQLINPPSVEGWHTGQEWIDGGALVRRVNFASSYFSNPGNPGIRSIVNRLRAQGDLSPEQFVDTCLDLIGPMEVGQDTREQLLNHAKESGGLRWDTEEQSEHNVGVMLALIGATREYQFG